MIPREPDRYDKIARDIFAQWERTRNAYPRDIAAALRQAADEALERAAQIVKQDHSCGSFCGLALGTASDRIRAIASPAAAPAAGWKCDACGDELASESAQRRHEATWHGAAPATETMDNEAEDAGPQGAGRGTFFGSPTKPVAPAPDFRALLVEARAFHPGCKQGTFTKDIERWQFEGWKEGTPFDWRCAVCKRIDAALVDGGEGK